MFSSAAFQVVMYQNVVENGHPEVFALPVVTNVASGLYEWYRSARRRVVEEGSSAGDLEKMVGN